MGKLGKSGAAVGFLFVTSAALLPAGVAAAAPDPALAGDCAKTLGADPGQALTLDAGAPLNRPALLTVGTGSPAAGDPALTVDAASLTHGLHADRLPMVTGVCDGVQRGVNDLSATTQTLLGGIVPAPPARPAPQPPAPAPAPQPPASGGGAAALPGGAASGAFPLVPTSPSAASEVAELLSPALLVAPKATGGLPPTGTSPGPDAQRSGTALALPLPDDRQAQLPLLLAAAALSVVGSLLAHTWLTRRPE